MRLKNPFGGMAFLIPCGKITQVFLVMPSEQITVNMEPTAQGAGGDSGAIQLPL
jgi:hypothetical protein